MGSRLLASLLIPLVVAGGAGAATLEVGPGKPFAAPSQAIAQARPGDAIEIAAGVYENDWAQIRADDLTLRGVGGKAVLRSEGMIANDKAIWVVSGSGVRIENVEFRGARVRDRNGAGLRLGDGDITLRHCGFFDNENGILGGHGDATIDIQHCEFGHNSLTERPAAHNLYIGRCRKLIFKFNYSHHAKVAHLLKSRARENRLMYNRLSDEAKGRSSYLINLPNAGRAYIVGNVLHQGPECRNGVMIAYGEEGPRGDRHELHLINNTLINERARGRSMFLQIGGMPDDFKPVVCNNIFAGRGQLTNWRSLAAEANFTGEVAEVGFVDRNDWNLRLKADSPCIDRGVAIEQTADGVDLTPRMHYVHPLDAKPRPTSGKLDLGAYERDEE